MTAKETTLKNINRVAETHFYVREIMISGLKNNIFTAEGKKLMGGVNTYYEYWINSFNDKFFDMGTLVRLGTEIERGLKYYYIEKKGYKNLVELEADPNYKQNIFQRILPWRKNNALDLFKNELGYDLNTNSMLKSIQELMSCRHLYAHNTGLLNNDFIIKYQKLTSIDILQIPNINSVYPQEDTHYFEPLEKINNFIQDGRKFISQLP